MPIDLPIELAFIRPLQVPDTPFRQCGSCHYVAIPTGIAPSCPGCGGPFGTVFWPEPELMELWYDEVFCWNHKKAELATVVAAMYFEASVFMLLFWATCWLDPELNWVGADFRDVKDKHERIQKYLNSITNKSKTDKALVRAFGASGKQMLKAVLSDDAGPFYSNYDKCRSWRNQIAHRGKRMYYSTIPKDMSAEQIPERDQALRASLRFVPECWVVFSKLWNEYLHKPMLAKKQDRKDEKC